MQFFFKKFITKFCSVNQCFTKLFVNKPKLITTKVFFPNGCKFVLSIQKQHFKNIYTQVTRVHFSFPRQIV